MISFRREEPDKRERVDHGVFQYTEDIPAALKDFRGLALVFIKKISGACGLSYIAAGDVLASIIKDVVPKGTFVEKFEDEGYEKMSCTRVTDAGEPIIRELWESYIPLI